jgi:hypothetical protein
VSAAIRHRRRAHMLICTLALLPRLALAQRLGAGDLHRRAPTPTAQPVAAARPKPQQAPHVKPGISYRNRGNFGLAHEVSLTRSSIPLTRLGLHIIQRVCIVASNMNNRFVRWCLDRRPRTPPRRPRSHSASVRSCWEKHVSFATTQPEARMPRLRVTAPAIRQLMISR